MEIQKKKIMEKVMKELREEVKDDGAVEKKLEAFEKTMKEVMEEVKRRVLRVADPFVEETLMHLKREIEQEKKEWEGQQEWSLKEMEEHIES